MIKLDLLSFFGFPLLISLAIYLALDSSTKTHNFTSSSYNSDFSTIQSFTLTLLADFDNEILYGNITFTIQIQVSVLKRLYLDMNDQKILAISIKNQLNESFDIDNNSYKIDNIITDNDEDSMDIGEKLTIPMPKNFFTNYTQNNQSISIKLSNIFVFISYMTSVNRNGRGINWLKPEQTFGDYPFFYTYCRPIKCRALAPIQDSLMLTASFQANILVPYPLKAVMAANLIETNVNRDISEILPNIFQLPNKYNLNYSNWTNYSFSQPFNTTPYQLNIAIGLFEEIDLTNNNTYYLLGESKILAFCNARLSNIQKYINFSKMLIGIDFPFSFVKIMVMPRAFMEDVSLGPNLMFISYSLLLNDNNAENILIKLIFNCYFGVMKTPKDWNDWYLVSGYAHYLADKIKQNISEAWSILSTNRTLNELSDVFINLCTEDDYCLLTELQPNLLGINSNHFDTVVPEYKGFYFLLFLEKILSNRTFNGITASGADRLLNFTNWILNHTDTSYLISYDTSDSNYMSYFVEYVNNYIVQDTSDYDDSIAIRGEIKWVDWWKRRNWKMLSNNPKNPSKLIEDANTLVQQYLSYSVINQSNIDEFNTYFPEAQEYLLNEILKSSLVNETLVHTLENNYNLSGSDNCNIKHGILELKIIHYKDLSNAKDEILHEFEEIIMNCARREILETLFARLSMKSNYLANITFYMYKDYLHPYMQRSFNTTLMNNFTIAPVSTMRRLQHQAEYIKNVNYKKYLKKKI